MLTFGTTPTDAITKALAGVILDNGITGADQATSGEKTPTEEGEATLQTYQLIHWTEAFLEIVSGINDLSRDTFELYAETLYEHRAKGNLFESELNDENTRDKRIDNFYMTYDFFRDRSDISIRAVFLKTDFMKSLALCEPCPLTPLQQTYVEDTLLPKDLLECKAINILENEEYKQWLTRYRLGCLKPEVISSQTD